MDDMTELTITAKSALETRYRAIGSWRVVAAGLPGFPKGYLNQVANGKRKPSNALLRALGLPVQAVSVPPCPTCGGAHTVGWCTLAEGEPRKAAKRLPSRIWRVGECDVKAPTAASAIRVLIDQNSMHGGSVTVTDDAGNETTYEIEQVTKIRVTRAKGKSK